MFNKKIPLVLKRYEYHIFLSIVCSLFSNYQVYMVFLWLQIKIHQFLFVNFSNICETHNNYNTADSTKKLLQTFSEYKTFYCDVIFAYVYHTCSKSMHMNSLWLGLELNTFNFHFIQFPFLNEGNLYDPPHAVCNALSLYYTK